MRACLLLCAALALAASRPRAAAAHRPAPLAHLALPAPPAHPAHPAHNAPLAPAVEPARLHHIKTQILAKLGLTSRPTPLGAPPRDVVRQILARAADPTPERRPEPEHSMREIIAIAHRGDDQHDDQIVKFNNDTNHSKNVIKESNFHNIEPNDSRNVNKELDFKDNDVKDHVGLMIAIKFLYDRIAKVK